MRRRKTGAAGFAAACALAAAMAGCSTTVDRDVAPAPGAPWQPPPEGRAKEIALPPPAAIPEEYRTKGAILSLEQVIDVALRNNPVTRNAWHQARAAAAELGAKRAAYFPTLELDGSITRQKQAALGGQPVFLQTTYGPSASLTWLLLDFGGRSADIAEARDALFSADWTHNAVLQNVLLLVEQAYYQYLDAKALRDAEEASVKQAREAYNAAHERHRAGVATIADELQAKTALSQAELSLEAVEGQIQTIRGALATALGVPANIPVEVGALPENVAADRIAEKIEPLIDQAIAERPDLSAARFEALKAQAHVQSVRAQGLPSLVANGSANRTYYYHSTGGPYSNNYAGSLLLRIPIFTGFAKTYETLKAKEEAASAREQLVILQDQVILQVWTSFYNVRTASLRIHTAADLLASARQSQDVALERYRAGVGGILELLTAQSAFAGARAQEVQARADWFLALAQLAHDTGTLSPVPGAPTQEEKR